MELVKIRKKPNEDVDEYERLEEYEARFGSLLDAAEDEDDEETDDEEEE